MFKVEEMLFAELNKRDVKKKEEQERIKKQLQQEKVDERNAVLVIQQELKKRKEDEQKYMSDREMIERIVAKERQLAEYEK